MARAMFGNLDRCESAAEDGEVQAQFNLGLMYATGRGAPCDFVVAHKWFNLASVQGSEDARHRRVELARDMSQSEIAEAQRLAREWSHSH